MSNLQGYCNFELIPYPKIVKAHIINDTTIKCITPSNIKPMSTSKSNFYANVYIAFNEKNITKYEKSLHYKESLLWVISGSTFYFYSIPYLMKIILDTVEINKISSSIYVKSIGSWNFQHSIFLL